MPMGSQRESMMKEAVASPTVSTKAVFLTACIDALEQRDVATIDLPIAYLHAYNDKLMHMKLTSKLAELTAEVAPNMYRRYITIDKDGQKLLFVVVQKAIYSMLKGALLFNLKLKVDLWDMGFTIKPYDPCVANKMFNRKQLTVTWHLDDFKASHVDP